MAQKYRELGERHLELLRVAADLARNDPAAVAQMYRAAQRMNLNTVGKHADRVAFLALVRGLEGAGCVEVEGGGLAASYGMLSVTKEGHRRLEATSELPGHAEEPAQEPPEAPERPPVKPERAENAVEPVDSKREEPERVDTIPAGEGREGAQSALGGGGCCEDEPRE